MSEQGDITKGHCNNCVGERDHHVLFELSEPWREVIAENEHGREVTINGSDRYEMLKCCGCGNISVRHTNWFSERTDDEGRPELKICYYPPAKSRHFPKWITSYDPEGFMYWPDHFVPSLLNQIYTALFNSCHALAAMGIRALLEQVMIETVGDHGTFANNLKKFEEEGYVGRKPREFLESVIELGHAVMHRKFDPTPQDVVKALDIAESMLAAVYLHGSHAEALKKRIPPRRPSKP